MFYHYNNFTEEELPVLSQSFADGNDNKFYHESLMKSGISAKNKFDMILSEKYQLVKQNDKTVLEVVFPRKSTIRLFILIISFIGFLYFGAWTFQMLERPNEIRNREIFQKLRQKFLNEHKCVSDSSLENFITAVENLKDMGLSASGNSSDGNWNIPTAVFFVTTLVTTIGYGNDKPLTVWGKIFCLIFVIIGLPSMMILATAVVERIFVFIDLTVSALCYKRKWKITEEKFREYQIIFCVMILICGFILFPAWAFSSMEDGRWSYLDSVYYCVISLTTIGLGDLVPGEGPNKDRRDLSKILSTVYLFVGLLWVSFCIHVFHRYHQWNVGAKFFYLESDISTFNYDKLVEVSEHLSNPSTPEVNNIPSYTNLVTLTSDNPSNGRKSRFKSYS